MYDESVSVRIAWPVFEVQNSCGPLKFPDEVGSQKRVSEDWLCIWRKKIVRQLHEKVSTDLLDVNVRLRFQFTESLMVFLSFGVSEVISIRCGEAPLSTMHSALRLCDRF